MVKVIMDVNKREFTFEELVEIIRILRAPGGCPWDAEQTHKSIRNEFIEETYEAVDAIDRDSNIDLCEELGDVLLQILLHSQIAKEENAFSVDDVINGIASKMILRHPHVFGDVKVSGTEDVLNNWDAIKKVEKNQTSASQTLRSVPMSFPALMRAEKVQKRAKKAGVNAEENSSLSSALIESADKLKRSVDNGDISCIADSLADIYFICCSISQNSGINSEEILNRKTDSFIDEFEKREKSGDSVADMLKA